MMVIEISSEPLQVLRLYDVVELVGLSRATVWRRVREGKFPAPIRLGQRAVGWRARDVRAWIESRPLACSRTRV